MSELWLEILKRQADANGRAVVARELGISSSTISLVLAGKYPAATDSVEARVMSMYGQGGRITCPQLGEVTPAMCVACWERAHKIGVRCGNPATIRLHKACMKCDLRK